MQLEAARHPGEAQSLTVEPNAAKLSEAERFPSSLAAESGESGFCAARLQTTEKSLKRIIQALQRPALQVHWQFVHTWQPTPTLRQFLALVDVSPRLTGLTVTINAFLKRCVVQFTLLGAQLLQGPVLALER
jgi:hypothetical protein